MTDEERDRLFAIAEKKLERAKKKPKKPMSEEEERYWRLFQERCDAESWGPIAGAKKAQKEREEQEALEKASKENASTTK